MIEIESKLKSNIEIGEQIGVAIYTATAKCAHEIAELEPRDQVTALLQIIREITLMIDDIMIDNEIEPNER